MKRSGIVHLTGALIAAFYLLAGPAAAQITVEPLPAKAGVQPCQQDVSNFAADAIDPVNWLYCIDAVGGYQLFGQASPGTYIFQVTQNNPGILAFSRNPSGPFSETLNVSLTIGSGGTGFSEPFYVLGQNLGTSVFTVCNTTRGCIFQDSILVLTVDKVEFEMIDSPLDTNPNAEGGSRIFPDRTKVIDPTDWKKVRVKATLSTPYPYAAMPVYFKTFDVDDPSANSEPVDANGSAGDDNRGLPKPGQLSATTATADASGVAQVEFTVTLQPGDNFKIAASCDPERLAPIVVSGTNLAVGTEILPSKHAKVTDMLTVWRRLHIEVDTMSPVQGNFVSGTVERARSTNKGTTVLTLTPLSSEDAAELGNRGSFAPGRITVDGVSFPVTRHSGTTVYVRGTFAQDPTNKTFKLVDDDDFNNDDVGAWDGDEGEALPEPDQSWAQNSDRPAENVFAVAYVKPIYDLVGDKNPNPIVPFVRRSDFLYSHFDNFRLNDKSYWTAYLLGTYQYLAIEDRDPDGEVAQWGRGAVSYGANIFLEIGRPEETDRYTAKAAFVNQAATTAHELGHWFQQENDDSNSDREGGLMCGPADRLKGTFSDHTLVIIRDKYKNLPD